MTEASDDYLTVCEEYDEHRGVRFDPDYEGWWECTVCGAEGFPEEDDSDD